MSIVELGALGEFVGAIAVVVTLVYLVIQVRLSSRATASNAIAQAASDHMANMRSLAENPLLAAAFEKTQRGEGLESPESTQIVWWLVSFNGEARCGPGVRGSLGGDPPAPGEEQSDDASPHGELRREPGVQGLAR